MAIVINGRMMLDFSKRTSVRALEERDFQVQLKGARCVHNDRNERHTSVGSSMLDSDMTVA